MEKAERVAQTGYKKALMGSSYDKMFPGWSSMVNKDVFASYFGTTDYYYDLAKNTRRMVILDKVRVVQNIALNTTNPYAKLPPIVKEITICYDMDDFITALSCQESGIIVYGTNEADEDDSEDEDSKKESFIQKLVNRMKEVNVMFDFVITNPPYSGSLHLSFFELGINHMRLDEMGKKCGQMTIIEPATWLINVRKNGKASRYDKIKNLIKAHLKSIKIENLNDDFSITDYHPLSITYVDFSQNYDTIEFECCGEKKIVNSLYDCNLIGSYDTIWSIFNKVLTYGDMLGSKQTIIEGEKQKIVYKHITTEKKDDGMWYAKYAEIVSWCGCNVVTDRVGMTYDSSVIWGKTPNGEHTNGYFSTGWHYYKNEIADHPLFAYDRGKHLLCDRYDEDGNFIPGKIAENIYGTKSELENWKHFIFNNKLPLFINIVLTIDQHNNSKEFLPWLVDKKYTDEEIYAKFNLTKDEIALIDKTLKKFERNSPWFKRYMCGPDADSTTKSIEADVADIVKGA